MKILYIPFDLDDSLLDLQDKAEKWVKNYNGKKDVVIVTHDLTSRRIEDVKSALNDGDCQIYILSHGINSSKLEVSNQTKHNSDYKKLSIEEVAERFKNDLMSSEFNNENIIKLYFCDEYAQDDKAQKMAKKFRNCLDAEHKDVEIKYYTDVNIGVPKSDLNTEMGSKAALRTCTMKNPLACFKLSYLVGNAKSYRQGLNEESAPPPHGFFQKKNTEQTEIKYPQYPHPILRTMAENLVKSIQNDKILSKHPHVAQEVIDLMPKDLKFYFANEIKISGPNIELDLKINKDLMAQCLKEFGLDIKKKTTIGAPKNRDYAFGGSDKEEDFSSLNTPYTALDDSDGFFDLADYDEVVAYSEAVTNQPKI